MSRPVGSDAKRLGVSQFGLLGRAFTPQQAEHIEALGFGAVWVGGSPAAELAWVEPILKVTTTLQVATGIVNIWSAAASSVAESFHRIERIYPGRFRLGIGAGHPESAKRYDKPYEALVRYLDQLDNYGVPPDRRVVAGLGPRVVGLSAQRSAGVIQYMTTPVQTFEVRKRIGPSAFVAVGQPVILTLGSNDARVAAREYLTKYLDRVNYRTNWKRLGFTDSDIGHPGSDHLIDAMVAHGSAEAVAARLHEHLDAGADHIAVQALTPIANQIPALVELAGALGLKRA